MKLFPGLWKLESYSDKMQ